MTPMTVSVREALGSDAQATARVYAESWRAAFGHVLSEEDVPAAVLRERGKGLVSAPMCLVAEQSPGEVLGVVAGVPASGHLDVLYVAPDGWGRGAGAALLAAAVARLSATGQRPWLWVWEENQRALAFYRREGWGDDGGRKDAVVGSRTFRYQRWTH